MSTQAGETASQRRSALVEEAGWPAGGEGSLWLSSLVCTVLKDARRQYLKWPF